MRWKPGGLSQDIEDERDQTGGGGRFRPGGIHIGLGGLLILLLLSWIFKQDFLSLVDSGSGGVGAQPSVSRIRHVRQARNRWFSSSLSCWTTPRTPGGRLCRRWVPNTATPSWCSFVIL